MSHFNITGNRVDDLNNFKYKKISWVDYNQFLNVILFRQFIKKNFSSTDGINLLILKLQFSYLVHWY